MADQTLIQKIQTLRPSAREVKLGTQFTDTMVDDYLTMFENLVLLANSGDSVLVRLAVVENDLGELTIVVTEHINNDSAHGVTGENIGNEDYCTSLVGGVVNLSALVSDAVDSTVNVVEPDADAATLLYSQLVAQTNVDLTNELKSSVNQLTTDLNAAITQINDLIAQQKLAKQMAEI